MIEDPWSGIESSWKKDGIGSISERITTSEWFQVPGFKFQVTEVRSQN
jgi:hypothetical protein